MNELENLLKQQEQILNQTEQNRKKLEELIKEISKENSILKQDNEKLKQEKQELFDNHNNEKLQLNKEIEEKQQLLDDYNKEKQEMINNYEEIIDNHNKEKQQLINNYEIERQLIDRCDITEEEKKIRNVLVNLFYDLADFSFGQAGNKQIRKSITELRELGVSHGANYPSLGFIPSVSVNTVEVFLLKLTDMNKWGKQLQSEERLFGQLDDEDMHLN